MKVLTYCTAGEWPLSCVAICAIVIPLSTKRDRAEGGEVSGTETPRVVRLSISL
jgi:hypothetical protein